MLKLISSISFSFPFEITIWHGTLRLYATSITPVFKFNEPSPLKRCPSGYTITPLSGLEMSHENRHDRTLQFSLKKEVNHSRLIPLCRLKNQMNWFRYPHRQAEGKAKITAMRDK